MKEVEEYPSYGCIPYKETSYGIMCLMVLNCDDDDHWEFPKGKPEESETEQETALRELKEETGLVGEIVDGTPVTFDFEYDVLGKTIHKMVKYFYCRVSNYDEVVLQTKEVGDYQWLGLDEIENKATYPKMKVAARKVREHFSH